MSKQVGAFAMDDTGADTGTGAEAGNARDLQARVTELEAQLQGERVERGRVKALSGENAELKARVAELESRGVIPDELRDTVPDEVVRATRHIADDAAKRNVAPIDARMGQLETTQRQTQQMLLRQFNGRVAARYPGFFPSVEGGDKTAQWQRFRQIHGLSLNHALAALDFETVCYFIDSFYRELGVPPDAGGAGAPAPDPRPDAGGASVAPQGGDGQRKYTFAEYSGILEKAQRDFHNGRLSGRDYNAVTVQMQSAFNEGRVLEPE